METKRHFCLRDLPAFDAVDQDMFSLICRQAAVKRHYQRSDVLFSQGDPSDTLFLIKEGSFKLVRVNEDGKEVILQLAGRGEVLGEAALFQEGTHPAAAIAMEPSRVCALSRRRLEEIIRDSPELALQVILSLGKRLNSTWEQTDLRVGPVRDKVLSLLLRLAGEYGVPCDGGTVIKMRLTQQDMADFIGASRVMVAKSLKDLATRNYVHRENKFYVLKDRCF